MKLEEFLFTASPWRPVISKEDTKITKVLDDRVQNFVPFMSFVVNIVFATLALIACGGRGRAGCRDFSGGET